MERQVSGGNVPQITRSSWRIDLREIIRSDRHPDGMWRVNVALNAARIFHANLEKVRSRELRFLEVPFAIQPPEPNRTKRIFVNQCGMCGSWFLRFGHPSNYCFDCRGINRGEHKSDMQKIRRARKRKATAICTGPGCSREFIKRKKEHIFCSHACQQAAWEKKQ